MRLTLVLAIGARLAQAGNVKIWPVDELATVVAVGRVDSVIRGSAAPGMRRSGGTDVRTCTAAVHVLRAIPAVDTPVIPLSYSCFGPVVRIANGPYLPPIQKGRVFLFPLVRRRKQWRLIGEQGMQLVRAVLEEAPRAFHQETPGGWTSRRHSWCTSTYQSAATWTTREPSPQDDLVRPLSSHRGSLRRSGSRTGERRSRKA